MRSVILGAAAVLALAGSAFAGQRVALRDDLAVSGAEVRLGDLFDNAGGAANVVVGRATGPNLVLDAARVQAAAAAHGLEWSNPNGYRQLVVKTSLTQAVPAAEPEPAAPSGVLARSGAAPVERMVEALVWTHDLATGDIVRNDDLVWTKLPARLVNRDAARDPDLVVGQAVRHALREGAPAAMHDLTPPRVIRRDQDVEVVFLQDGIRLVLTGRAMADAALGDPVEVLNLQSKKTVAAVASGPGQAMIGPAADAFKSSRLASLH